MKKDIKEVVYNPDHACMEVIEKLNSLSDRFPQLKKETFRYNKKLGCWISVPLVLIQGDKHD